MMHIQEEEEGSLQEMETVKSLYVRTVAAAPTPTPTPAVDPDPTEEPPEQEEEAFVESYSDGGYSGDGGSEEEQKKGTPRVIVEGFTTKPEQVKAGETFELLLKVRNTSKKTGVGNMALTLQSPQGGENETAAEVFLPADGANTLYIEHIPKNSTKEVSVKMTSRSDLVQKPYPIEIQLKYEDDDANEFEGTLNISIPVLQKARFELSSVQVMPEAISVGEETNVTFEIYNLGKTKLYNVSARIEDASLVNGEAFVGNIEAGATGSVDMMVQGAAESSGDGTVKLLVSYEDQDGNQSIYETECIIFVSPAMDMDETMMFDDGIVEDEPEQGKGRILIWAVAAIAVIAGVIAGGRVLVKRKRRKEEEWANELLGSDQDELQ